MDLNFEAPSVMMMVMGLFLINHALDGAKLFHVARDGNGAFLIKAIFIFSSLEKLHEEGVVDVNHWDHKSLLLLTLAHQDCQTPFWDVLHILLLILVMVMKMQVRNMQVKIYQMVFVIIISSKPHIFQKKPREMIDLIKSLLEMKKIETGCGKLSVIRKQKRKARDLRKK